MSHRFITRSANAAICSSLGLALLLLGLGGGCRRSTTVVGPKGEKATITQKGDHAELTIKGEHGEEARISSGKSVALPEGFPKDVAVYPQATVAMSMKLEKGMQVMLKTADSIQEVETFYKEQLKKDGWKIQGSMNTPQMILLNGEKDKRTLMVSIATEADESMITLTVTEKDQ